MSRLVDFVWRRRARFLGSYWDALQTGAPPIAPRSEDLPLANLVEHMHEITHVPGQLDRSSDPVLDRLVSLHKETSAMQIATQPQIQSLPDMSGSLSTASIGRDSQSDQRWSHTIQLAAAVLLIAVAGTVTAWFLSDREPDKHIAAPASVVQASPAPTETTVVEIPVPADVIPASGVGVAGIYLFTMEPNSTGSWGGGFSAQQAGVWANYIADGSMSVIADAEVVVIRSDRSQETFGPDVQFTLNAGDTALHRQGKEIEWVNAGQSEVKLISVFVADEPYVIYPRSFLWTETGSDVDDNASIPPGTWVIRLEVKELEPEGTLPPPTNPDLRFASVAHESDASLTEGPNGELTLSGAEIVTTVYVYTLERTDPLEATQES